MQIRVTVFDETKAILAEANIYTWAHEIDARPECGWRMGDIKTIAHNAFKLIKQQVDQILTCEVCKKARFFDRNYLERKLIAEGSMDNLMCHTCQAEHFNQQQEEASHRRHIPERLETFDAD